MIVTLNAFLWSIAIILVVVQCYNYLFDRPPNFPKGPPRLPLLGGFAFMLMINHRHLHMAAVKLSEFYRSKLIGIFIAEYPTVIINDLDIIKEVMHREEFDGRPNLLMVQLREKNFRRRGIFFTDGPEWREQRRFSLRHLRDYGFGRRFPDFEAGINTQIETLIEQLRHGPKYEYEKEFLRADGTAMAPHMFTTCFANAILHVVSGDRFDRKDAGVLIEMGKYAMTFQRLGDGYGTLVSLMPWIRHIIPKASKYQGMRESHLAVNDFIESIIQKHLASYEDGHVRSFLDLYIQKMRKSIPKEGDSFSFQYDQLLQVVIDFVFPPLTSLGTHVALLLERLLLNPEVIRKMQAEIDEVVGSGRLPSLDDRINLPYTEATLREDMRIDSFIPSGLPHAVMEDTKLRGYDLPRGTLVILGMHAGHNQQDVWGDPDVFRPERFLDVRGKLSLIKDISVPFGAGRRLCAGETFSRNMMFLVVAALVQNFNLKPVGELPDLSKRITGVSFVPPDYWLKFEPR